MKAITIGAALSLLVSAAPARELSGQDHQDYAAQLPQFIPDRKLAEGAPASVAGRDYLFTTDADLK